MPILGHGIDIVETLRVKRLVDEHGQRFLDRCFTPSEQDYCSRSPKRYYEHLAGRFAAKEAVLKVLGTGWRGSYLRAGSPPRQRAINRIFLADAAEIPAHTGCRTIDRTAVISRRLAQGVQRRFHRGRRRRLVAQPRPRCANPAPTQER